ncbi:protein cornichon homolog 3 isoform X3 [Mirounga leonina]|uniref:protein cornichon homolog 3 isoform X3 n=1 Tax=Mirounga leonina TaxID=9715 RepID=UPI00156C524D|nr:protein cornichon homolog 3 isoform X3 [Mirounga leonina]
MPILPSSLTSGGSCLCCHRNYLCKQKTIVSLPSLKICGWPPLLRTKIQWAELRVHVETLGDFMKIWISGFFGKHRAHASARLLALTVASAFMQTSRSPEAGGHAPREIAEGRDPDGLAELLSDNAPLVSREVEE